MYFLSSISEPSASFNLMISASFCTDVLLLKSSVHEETVQEGICTMEPSLCTSWLPPQPFSQLPSLPSCPSLVSCPLRASSSPDPPCLPPDLIVIIVIAGSRLLGSQLLRFVSPLGRHDLVNVGSHVLMHLGCGFWQHVGGVAWAVVVGCGGVWKTCADVAWHGHIKSWRVMEGGTNEPQCLWKRMD